jgi:hypothetical protein
LGLGTWDLGLGTWDLGLGTWDLGLGTWDLGLGDAGTKKPADAGFSPDLSATLVADVPVT